MNTAASLAQFVEQTGFENIPRYLVEEAKRLLMDSLGCALAGGRTEKGRIALEFAGQYGVSSEATIIGGRQRAPVTAASFVNGELFNALDYEPLCAPSGHITPYVLSALLAVAEIKHASGKKLITAIVLAHEIAQRVIAGLVPSESLSRKNLGEGRSFNLPVQGYGATIFGGIAGAAALLGLSAEKTEQAFGIGASLCPVPALMQFVESVPAGMSKFSPAGWISQAEVSAVLLARQGYRGAHNVFDSEYPFWKSFASEGWNREIVLRDLGDLWYISNAIGYKRYPCCGAMHEALDIFCAIIDTFDIEAVDIRELTVAIGLLGELALWKNRTIENHVDAQFSSAYVFAVAAHRLEPGSLWQEPQTGKSPEIVEFMKKITILLPTSRQYAERNANVAVVAFDRRTNKEIRYTENDIPPVSAAMNDRELSAKFEKNAEHLLSPDEVGQVRTTIQTLEKLDDISKLLVCFEQCHSWVRCG